MKKIKKMFFQLSYFLNIKKIHYFFYWIKSFVIKNGFVVKNIPWITFESKMIIDKIINKDFVIFEWGSGGSTIYFSGLVKGVISVEHDKEWFLNVKNEIEKQNIGNCDYLLIEPEINNSDSSLENIFISDNTKYLGMNFKKYCDAINSYPDNYFDLIFVDGRARNGCIKNAISKLKKGGYLILDNSERSSYDIGRNMLKGFEKKKFYGPGPFNLSFWETSIFKKII